MWPLPHLQLLSLMCLALYVTKGHPGAVSTEPSGLWASPFWMRGDSLGPGYSPFLTRDPLPLLSCWGQGQGGCRGHGWFRTEALRRADLLPSESLQLFLVLAVFLLYFLSLESSYRLSMGFLMGFWKELWMTWKSCSLQGDIQALLQDWSLRFPGVCVTSSGTDQYFGKSD